MKRLLATLFLVPQLAWGAHDFDSGAYAEATAVEVSAAPVSFCGWFLVDDATGVHTPISQSRSSTTTERWRIAFRGNDSGDPVWAEAVENNSGGDNAVSGTYTASVYHHVCAVYSSSTVRTIYLDGTGTSNISGTSRTPQSLDRLNLFALWAAAARSASGSGRAAEVGIYSAALTAAEVATLAKGFPPPCVRRMSIVGYYPMIRDATSLKDLFSATANNLTLAGTTAVADHPRVINCN